MFLFLHKSVIVVIDLFKIIPKLKDDRKCNITLQFPHEIYLEQSKSMF